VVFKAREAYKDPGMLTQINQGVKVSSKWTKLFTVIIVAAMAFISGLYFSNSWLLTPVPSALLLAGGIWFLKDWKNLKRKNRNQRARTESLKTRTWEVDVWRSRFGAYLRITMGIQ